MKTRSAIVVLLFGVLLAASPAWADAGTDAYQAGDYETALKELVPAATAGTPQAAYTLGLMYERGEGVGANPSRAYDWYFIASGKNHALSHYRMGRMAEAGRGVPYSPKGALASYLKAAKSDHVKSMVRAGLIYLGGRGVKTDVPQGLKLLTAAAAAGDIDAMAALDNLAEKGRIKEIPLLGESSPTDPTARKVLNDAVAILRPYTEGTLGMTMVVDGLLRVYVRDGRYLVYVPKVRLKGNVGEPEILIGTMLMDMEPAGVDHYRIKLSVPSNIKLVQPGGRAVASLETGEQDMSFLWSMSMGSALEGELSLSDLVMTAGRGDFRLDVSGVDSKLKTSKPTDGMMDGQQSIKLSGLKITSPVAEGGGEVSIASITMENGFNGLDLAKYLQLMTDMGIDWSTGAVAMGASPVRLDLPLLFKGLSVASSVQDLRIKGYGLEGGEGELKEISFSFGVKGLDSDGAVVEMGFDLKGLNLPGSGLKEAGLPETIGLALSLGGIPVAPIMDALAALSADVANVAGAMGTPPVTLMYSNSGRALDLLSTALQSKPIELKIAKITFGSDAYEVTVSGDLSLQSKGTDLTTATKGTLTVDIKGLDRLMASVTNQMLADRPGGDQTTALMDKIAGTSGGGEGVNRFKIEFKEDGEILINGTPLQGLLAPPEVEPAPAPTPEPQRP